MRYFKKVLYIDGGPNDRGTVIGYKVILNSDSSPKSKNGFERWEEITSKQFDSAYKEAKKQIKMFEDAFKP